MYGYEPCSLTEIEYTEFHKIVVSMQQAIVDYIYISQIPTTLDNILFPKLVSSKACVREVLKLVGVVA